MFTTDIIEIVDAFRKNPSYETITLLSECFECSELYIHTILSKYLSEYKELFKSIGPPIQRKRKNQLDLGGRPCCPYCGSPNPKSEGNLWRCKTCKRQWLKNLCLPIAEELTPEEKLEVMERKNKAMKRKIRRSLKRRSAEGLQVGRPMISSELSDQVLSLRDQHLSYRTIGGMVGLSPACCWHVVKRKLQMI